MIRLLALTGLMSLALAPAASLAQPGLAWETPDQGAVADLLQLKVFHTALINTGSATGTYRVTMTAEAPPAWVTSMCEGDFCYAPFVREFDFTLAPGDTNDIGANITPVTNPGLARVRITVTNLEVAGLAETRSFAVVTPGADLLIVDADPLGDPVPLATAAVAALGQTAVAYPAKEVGSPDQAVLAAFPAVLWAAGQAVAGIDAAGRAALEAYVQQQGGHLWLAGSNLAFSLCATSSPAYSPEARAWFNLLAGADWVAFDAGSASVTGVPQDALGDGLVLALGGDGAPNNAWPDELAVTLVGTACLTYGTGAVAAVRRSAGDGRVVATAFTLEGVDTAAGRADLAAAVLGWFAGGVSAVDELPEALAGVPRAVPNPFNPRTRILFVVGGPAPRDVSVTVHDLRGRLVRRLLAARLAPGPHQVRWDGRDEAGRTLAAGVYVARVGAGAERTAVKLTLAK